MITPSMTADATTQQGKVFNKYCLIKQTYTWEKEKRSLTCMSHRLQKLIQMDLKTKGKK